MDQKFIQPDMIYLLNKFFKKIPNSTILFNK